jgi:phosphohistidine phosphatase
MARQLWLLRHAVAEPHGTRPDAQRKLTASGQRQAQAAGIALARLGVEFDAVLFSPKARARHTAEIAAKQWSAAQRERLRRYPPLAGHLDAARARAVAAELPANARLLLVGHEPHLSRLVAEITGGRVNLKKGGVAAVRLEGLGGELALLLRPRDLALIAGSPAGGK